jgi:hypothetical protein
MAVWVVMGNDFPDSVFSNSADAASYVARMYALEKKKQKGFGPRIYWRSYRFEVDGKR